MLTISDLTYRIAGRTIFDKASLSLSGRVRVGLVGRNGAGKTTLFRLITGILQPESGDVRFAADRRIGEVAQEAPATDETLLEVVLKADRERHALLAEAETATDPGRIAAIQVRLADIGAHAAPARAAAILSGLGFDEAAQQRACRTFSGGWRMRVALAGVLFAEPDLLLLDEPTNYLDIEGTMWLESYLGRYPHSVLLISHDRDLLNGAVEQIVHVQQGKLTLYRGGYDSFERQLTERRRLAAREQEKQEERRKHLQSFVDRFRAKASKARQAQSRIRMLEKMQPVEALIDESSRPFRFDAPPSRLAPPIIRMEGATAGYAPGAAVLRRLDLRIDEDDRIALLGANGNGKSTFAKLISGRLAPLDGTVTRAARLKVAYFAQHQLDELEPDETPVAHVRRLAPGLSEAEARSRVDGFGLPTDRMNTRAGELSGGEKARLLMGLATFGGAHLLILDEPTNHLDIDSRAALVEAINGFDGAVVLISHDRRLVESCADRLWLVANGTVGTFDGDLDDYRQLVVSGGPERSAAAKAGGGEPSAQERRRTAAARRAELAPLKRRITELDRVIADWQKRIAAFDATLADPALYTRDPERGVRVSRDRAAAAKALAEAEDQWLELSGAYEEAMAEVGSGGQA